MFSHHTSGQVGLYLLWLGVFQVQNVKISFSIFQNPLAVQHSLLKVSWFLEQLVFRTNLTELPLNRRRYTRCTLRLEYTSQLLKSEQILKQQESNIRQLCKWLERKTEHHTLNERGSHTNTLSCCYEHKSHE